MTVTGTPVRRGQGRRSPGRGFREQARFLSIRPRDVLVVTVLSVVSGLMQAAILLIVVRTAANLSPSKQLRGSFGPIDLTHASSGELLGAGVVLVLASLVVEVISAYVAARLSSRTQHRLRSDLILHFTEATWATQQAERRGELD